MEISLLVCLTEGHVSCIDRKMALRALIGSICLIRADLLAPGADTLTESSESRDVQSIRSASPKPLSSARWSISHTSVWRDSL